MIRDLDYTTLWQIRSAVSAHAKVDIDKAIAHIFPVLILEDGLGKAMEKPTILGLLGAGYIDGQVETVRIL